MGMFFLIAGGFLTISMPVLMVGAALGRDWESFGVLGFILFDGVWSLVIGLKWLREG
jgi:hypothetical protein